MATAVAAPVAAAPANLLVAVRPLLKLFPAEAVVEEEEEDDAGGFEGLGSLFG